MWCVFQVRESLSNDITWHIAFCSPHHLPWTADTGQRTQRDAVLVKQTYPVSCGILSPTLKF